MPITDERAPYSLFQGEDGKWGVKDNNGAIVYEATYIRRTEEDGEDTIVQCEFSVIQRESGFISGLVFSTEDGFFPIAFWDPDFLEWLSEGDDDEDNDDKTPNNN